MSPAGEHESRERSAARSLLMAADCVTAASVALLALNALRPGAGLVGIALIVAVAIAPRLAAEVVESPRVLFQRGRRLTPAGLISLGVVLLALPFAYRVFDLAPSVAGLGFELILLAMVWIAGFGLRDPATYVVYEPLALATVLLSLARGAAHAGLLVAAAFLAICVSGALRRQLAHSTDSRRTGRVNVRSARILGALAALALILVFTLSNETLQPVLKRTSAPLGRGGAGEAPARQPGQRGDENEEPGETDESGGSGESTGPGEAGNPREDGGRRGRGRESPEDPRDSRGDPVERPADRMAKSQRSPHDVAPPSLRRGENIVGQGRNVGPVILRVTPADAGPESDERRQARPDARTLWKARTYSRFDAPKQEWADDDASQWFAPVANDRTIRLAPDRGRPSTTWEAVLAGGRLDCLLLPYSTHEIGLETSGSAADLRTNLNGDVTCARPGLRVSPTYWIVVQPLGASWAETTPGLLPAAPALAAEIEVPDSVVLGADVVAHAVAAMGRDDASLAVKLAKLKAYMQAKFRYAKLDTKRLPEDFGQFLREKRVGVAEHFATAAALMLRASGVPSRLVKGYAGGRWEPASSSFVVRAGNSHAWIEISTTEGWLPLDPADWVLTSPQARAEEEAARLAQQQQQPKKPERDARPSETFRPPAWLVFVVAAVALALSLFGFFRKRRSEPRPDEQPEIEEADPAEAAEAPEFVPRTPAERLLVEYGHLQGDLAVTGQERRQHETPREHARRVSVPPRAKVDAAFSSLVPMIDDGLYGHVDLTEADLERGRRNIADLKKELG
jgi:hypothetical protein